MSDVLSRWNILPVAAAVDEILPCCGSRAWADGMVGRRPLPDEVALLAASDETWRSLAESDWLGAFPTHSRIGELHGPKPTLPRSAALSRQDGPVGLEGKESSSRWRPLALAQTDQDGRCAQLLPANEVLSPGVYRLVFDIAGYYVPQKIDSLYPLVEIAFHVRESEERFHIPLLLSPNGYTTYRGS